MSSETPDLGELLLEVSAFTIGQLSIAIPAVVVSYDPARQAITAKPTVSGRYQDPGTGALVPFPLPTVANVPVVQLGGVLGGLNVPLSPGDTVLLVCADRSLDEWKALGSPETVPQDTRRCDLTDAIAIAGLRPFSTPTPPTNYAPGAVVMHGADVRLGSSAAVDFVALASRVLAELASIKAAFDAHVHPVGGAAPPFSGVPSTPMPAPGSVAATKVKAE